MSISVENRNRVRIRASFSCEFCGVSETNTASELTIDHFQPISKGGSDNLENLVYSCIKCNSYKSDYFPEGESDTRLFNPRLDNRTDHFILLENG